jgi:hypothetical protein
MNKKPTFFNSDRIKQLLLYFCGAIALVVFLGWLAAHYIGVKIDWSFLIPLGGLTGVMIPFATGVVGYLDKRLKQNDDRITALEIQSAANQQIEGDAAKDRHELRKIILKLEARIESIRDEKVGNQMVEMTQMLRQLLDQKKSDAD